MRLSASAGLAVYPHDGRMPAALIRAADAVMYAVKRQGGDGVGDSGAGGVAPPAAAEAESATALRTKVAASEGKRVRVPRRRAARVMSRGGARR